MKKIASLVKEIKKDSNFSIPLSNIDYQLWAEWYRGNVKDIHNRRIWNGEEYLNTKLKSLQMAKKICEDWANLIMNERCDIILPNKKANDILEGILYKNDFWVIANESVEKSFALGLGALVLSVNDIIVGDKGTNSFDEAKLKIDFVDRFKITPLLIEDNKIKEVAFKFEGSNTTKYIIHVRDENKLYHIHSYEYENKGDKLVQNITFNTESRTAWFQIIRPFISNNNIADGYDVGLGISVFANSLDTLHAVDNKYDSFDNEFIAGRKKLHVSDEAWRVHNKKDGQQEKTFNPMDTFYYKLPSTKSGEQLIEDKSGPLRSAEHISGLNAELNFLSSKTGFGEAYYKFDPKGMTPTATQVISENSSLFKTLKKHQILIEAALRNLTIAIIEASQNFTEEKIILNENEYSKILIEFDDSIIEDKGTEMERDKNLVQSGLMSNVEFRQRWLGEDEKTAIENYRKYFKYEIINKYMPAVAQGLMTPKQFVLEVYGHEDVELEKYIEDNRATSGGFDEFTSMFEGD